MFDFVIKSGRSYLDLACGFGRFLHYLDERVDEPDYIGYDSSQDMIDRLKERFPDYLPRVFLRDITQPITHPQESVLASAVFIHIPIKCQDKILENLKSTKSKAICFDINSPPEPELDRLKIKQSDHYERYIKTTRDGVTRFRMTWQSHYEMTKKLLNSFPNYNLTTKFYDLKLGRFKVVYMLTIKNREDFA